MFNQEAFLNDLCLLPFLISYIFEEVEMRQNHKKLKAMVVEKTTDNPGVESDNTVIAIENKI